MRKPKALSIGDTIGVFSPAGVTCEENVQETVRCLEAHGFSVKFAPNTFRDTYGYAASPEERAADFNQLIADDSVAMLLFSGGEVCNEILPYMDFEAVRQHPKIISTYSDGTTLLNAITAQCGLPTFYGQALCTFSPVNAYNYACFEAAFLQSGVPHYHANSPWKTLRGGVCDGRLIGGYLANFALMLGGDYLRYKREESHILLIEDHIKFSSPAVVSKYFAHIEQSGLFDCVSGLIFGHYGAEGEASARIDEILLRLAHRYEIPVVRNDDFGHGPNNAILPIGMMATLDAGACTLTFEESFVCSDTLS